jgi:hypothetical protein
MRKATVKVYVHKFKCFECNKTKTVYYTVADFGDAPHIMHCYNCGELYWYTPEDENYIMPIEKKLTGLKCEKCNSALSTYLTPTHKCICCEGDYISLDEDFAIGSISPNSEMVPVVVYLIYS